MSGLDSVLAAAKSLFAAHPDMMAFVDWPDDTPSTGKMMRHIPATDIVAGFDHTGTDSTQPLIDAIRAAARDGCWIRTYTEEEVGAHFRENYGYFELVGPTGHSQSDSLRAYVAYWGPGLNYDWHRHEAEELYVCLAGGATFYAEGREPVDLAAGETLFHATNQSHAMVTTDQPILTLVLWRGAGLAGLPTMDAA